MKVADIVEGYGVRQGIPSGIKAKDDNTNLNKRLNARAADSNREANIAQQQANRSAKRKRYAPTGIPSRLLQPQTPASPEGEQ